jgi:hypothetical protein
MRSAGHRSAARLLERATMTTEGSGSALLPRSGTVAVPTAVQTPAEATRL